MRLALERDDRWLLIISGAILIAATLAGVHFSPTTALGPRGFPSTYSSAGEGAKAAYLLLAELGYQEERWTKPPSELPLRAERAILILADPYFPAPSEEKQAIRDFVLRGGRVIATGPEAAALLNLGGVSFIPLSAAKTAEFTPRMAGPLSRQTASISMNTNARWRDTDPENLVYFGDENGGVVVRTSLGPGTIVWWADSSPLSNDGIVHASNLNLLLNSVDRDPKTLILWDEYYHGERKGLWDYLLAGTPLPWGLLQAAVLALAAILTYSRRSGPILAPVVKSRLSPIEFVETVGDLYARKHAATPALESALNRFRSQLARSLRLPGDTPLADLRPLIAQLGAGSAGLPELLTGCEAAIKSGIANEKQVLQYFQELHRYTRRLRLAGQGGRNYGEGSDAAH